ncbi:MAG: beta-propeller fold lactonase family protein [Burkholderiales bacterium]|nr:beta-propeller fold lactonase family protein [Burkholderiales bacterium]
MNKLITFIALTGCIILSACNSNYPKTTSNATTIATAITINNAGVVPILNNNATNSVIYVHNNSNTTISGITYTAFLNIDNSAPHALPFLNPDSVKLCSTIKALQSCALKFTTPPLPKQVDQGSAIITLNYSSNDKKNINFSQILNFKVVTTLESGVNFTSGVRISGFGHKTGYGTVYLYNNNSNNAYIIANLNIDKTAFKITQGNIKGQKIMPQGIAAVEIAATGKSKAIAADLTINANSDDTLLHNYTSIAAISANSIVTGGILIAGEVPVINTAESSTPNSSLLISNVGNSAVILESSSSSSSEITNLNNCESGTTLDIGESCVMTFNVTQNGGSGIITLNYLADLGSTSVTQAVNWYNSTDGTLISMDYTNPINLQQSQSQSESVTITNIGGYNLTDVIIESTPVTLSGSATATVSYPDNQSCANANLALGQSCVFILTITDNNADTSGQILFKLKAKYNNGTEEDYSRYGILDYSITPNTYFYNTNLYSADITPYSVNYNTGALASLSPASYAFTTCTYGYNMTTSPNGQFLYATCYNANGISNIYGYNIDQNTGTLTNISGSPFNSGESTPYFPAITPNGKFLYVGTLNNITAFNIQADGSLTDVSGSPFATTYSTQQIIIDPTGSFLYTYASGTSFNIQILEYSINQDSGALTLIGTVNAGQLLTFNIVLSPNNKFIYVQSTGSNAVYAYAIQPDGTLSTTGTYSAGNAPSFIAITPDDNFLYVSNLNSNSISAYLIDQTTGALSQISGSPFTTSESASYPYQIVITDNGSFLYVSNGGGYPAYAPSSISAFTIGSDGGLTKINEYSIESGGGTFIVDSAKNFLYLMSELNNNIGGYNIDPVTGALTPIAGSPFATGNYPYDGLLFN